MLKKFFYPKSVAVIGASNKPNKVGYTLFQKLKNFKGRVFYINAEGYYIEDKLCYKNLLEVKEKVDLVIIAVPAVFVKEVLIQCAHKNVNNVIILSAGFSESGNTKLTNEILEIIKKEKIRVLGPNNFGIVNTSNSLDCTFSKLSPNKGDISFISQSGALWSSIVDFSISMNIGFSNFVSLGDMLDVDFSDVIEYLSKDEQTKIIILYIENVNDGKRFMSVLSKCRKPVIAIKGGKTRRGSEATLSHTGSLAGSYEIYKAALKQSGCIFVENIEEALSIAKLLSFQSKPRSNKVVVVTNAGGPGILMTDYLVENGIEIIDTSNIKFGLPDAASVKNPIDVLGDAKLDSIRKVFNNIYRLKSFDILILILTPQSMTDDVGIAKEFVRFFKSSKKNCIACFLGVESFVISKNILEESDIPCFDNLEILAESLGSIINK